jgi:hypothetical protein
VTVGLAAGLTLERPAVSGLNASDGGTSTVDRSSTGCPRSGRPADHDSPARTRNHTVARTKPATETAESA